MWVCVWALTMPVTDARAQSERPPVTSEQLAHRVAQLRRQVTELAGRDNLLDTLHFGWLDRPYGRATLAVLAKTTAVLEREVLLRRRGNGALPEATIARMLYWSDAAAGQACLELPSDDFRPHRLSPTAADVLEPSDTPPLFGFVDRSSATRHHATFGDLDILTAMGFRVYGLRLAGTFRPRQDRDPVFLERATALGLIVAGVETPPAGVASLTLPSTDLAPTALGVRPLALRQWIDARMPRPGPSETQPAIVDPIHGEPVGASVARRALARGRQASPGFVIDGWQVPRLGGASDLAASATKAAVWAAALDGPGLVLVHGWRDLRDGSGSLYESVHLDPTHVEAVAHAGLDLLRHDVCTSRVARPLLAILVGRDAVSNRDPNRWAPWTLPVWTALVDQQIQFDVLSTMHNDPTTQGRYQVIFPLRRDDSTDPSSVVARVERALAEVEPQMQRVTAREPGGHPARNVLVRTWKTPAGDPRLAVVNLAPNACRLSLHGALGGDRLHDLILRTTVRRPEQGVDFEPFQVRLFTSGH
jgi:hypothetical protein